MGEIGQRIGALTRWDDPVAVQGSKQEVTLLIDGHSPGGCVVITKTDATQPGVVVGRHERVSGGAGFGEVEVAGDQIADDPVGGSEPVVSRPGRVNLAGRWSTR